jgi:hypothetical protein
VTLGTGGSMNDNRDAQYLYLYEEVARRSVARFHELPFWDPYYCGGLPALGTPSARFASPTFLLTLALGTIRADALVMFAMTLVGLEGMYRYARTRGGGALGSVLVAPVFALSGFFGRFPTYGWTHFYGFELVPWALLGMRMALGGSRRGVVTFALAIAWMIGFGGTYAAPITAVGAGVEIVEALLRRGRRPRAALHALAMAWLAVLFAIAASLVRLWPIAEMLSAAPRILGGTDGHGPREIWSLLFGAPTLFARGGDFLVGLLLLPVFFLGCLRRRSMPLLFAGLAWIWLSLGYDARPSLFAWLRFIPPYTMLRAPERFLTLFSVVFAVVTALALRRLEATARRRPWVLVPWVVCVALALLDVTMLVRNATSYALQRTMIDTPPTIDRDFHQARGNRWLSAYYPFMSRGSLACFDDYNVAQSPDLRGDLEHEEYLRDPSAGSVERLDWSPNHIRLRAKLARPARVYVNQNWHPGWRSTAGTVVTDGGLLAIDLPAGDHEFELAFLPRSGLVGGATSLAALAVAGLALFRSRRSRDDRIAPGRPFARDLVLFASPFACVALSFVLVYEPRRPPPALVTPSGEPMLVDALPEGITPLDATWAEGIELVGAHFHTEPTRLPTEKVATIELDWKLTKAPPKGLGVYLELDGQKRTLIGVDYALLSGVLLFEDAPKNRILRDVGGPILLPWIGQPIHYDVWVVLYRARRSGERLTQIEGTTPHVESEGKVFVGSFVAP